MGPGNRRDAVRDRDLDRRLGATPRQRHSIRVLIIVALLVLGPSGEGAAQVDISYRIPPDNPFAARQGAAPEVYAYGLRNPFRFSFDRMSGDLLIGDVGQGAREEVDWIAARDAAGANFGWACREGTVPGPKAGTPECQGSALVEPLFDYPRTQGRAVTGGVVVRDPSLTGLFGRYLYTDFYAGDVRSLRLDGSNPDDTPTGLMRAGIASFGEDASGRIYVADLDSSQVLRLVAGSSAGTVSEQPLSGTFDQPVAVAGVPGDPDRLLVAETPGRLRMVLNGTALPTPFLDITALVTSGGEQGLLGVAAAPDYASTGKFYVYYTDVVDGDIRIDELERSSDPNLADPTTRRAVLEVPHPFAANHNGGTVAFGPDGCLWAATGDGGGGNDEFNQAQDLITRLGKLLRIDPDPPGVGGAVCSFADPRASQPYPVSPPQTTLPGVPATRTSDLQPPRLRLRIPRRQRVLRLGGAVAYARCDERCQVSIGGRVKLAARRIKLRRMARSAGALRWVRMRLALTPAAERAIRRARRRGVRSRLRVGLRASDAAGNASSLVRVTVRPAVNRPRR
jgi:glucose/arabinose dehydrogenase